MSIAPQPAPTWPAPQPVGPPPRPRRRWPAIAATTAGGALIGGLVAALVTIAATPNTTPLSAPPQPVTVTAAPPPPPPALPVEEADAQTCHAWGTADRLVTAAISAMQVIPEDVTIDSPAVQDTPAWRSSVMRASTLFNQAASTFETQIAPGTSPMLAQTADTAVSALRTLSEAYKTFDPISGNSVPTFRATQKALDWLCR